MAAAVDVLELESKTSKSGQAIGQYPAIVNGIYPPLDSLYHWQQSLDWVVTHKHTNIWNIFLDNCHKHPNRKALVWLNEVGNIEVTWTYGELLQRVTNVAHALLQHPKLTRLQPGARVVLCHQPGVEFYVAFWACVSLGLLAVPVQPPDPTHATGDAGRKLRAILQDAQPDCVLTDQIYYSLLKRSVQFTGVGHDIFQFDVMPWIVTTRMMTQRAPEAFGRFLAEQEEPIILATAEDDDHADAAVAPKSLANWSSYGLAFRRNPQHIAFLQYTSGSTGMPKGVMVAHCNIIANCTLIHEQFMEMMCMIAVRLHCAVVDQVQGVTWGGYQQSCTISWLPTFHDMGLIGVFLAPMLGGNLVVCFSPLTFITNPMVWLREIGRHKYVMTAAPPFALDLCCKRVTDKDLQSLNLAPLLALLVGASPIEHEGIERFLAKFKACGVSPHCIVPSYGMAENVLFATGKKSLSTPHQRAYVSIEQLEKHNKLEPILPSALANGLTAAQCSIPGELSHLMAEFVSGVGDVVDQHKRGRWLVGCGQRMTSKLLPNPGAVIVVNQATGEECEDGDIGEIWICGQSRTLGYWQKPDVNRETFQARLSRARYPETARMAKLFPEFLRTGDLGAYLQGELYVCGRIKDMIIVKGANYYPHDIEQCVKELELADVRPGSIAAFSVPQDEAKGEYLEQLALVVELRSKRPGLANASSASGDAASSGEQQQQQQVKPLTDGKLIKLGMLALNVLDRLPDRVSSFLVQSAGVAMRGVTDCRRKVDRVSRRLAAAADGSDIDSEPGLEEDETAIYSQDELEDMANRIRKAVFKNFNMAVYDLVLAKQGFVLKTSSGKIRHRETQQLLRSDHQVTKTKYYLRSKAMDVLHRSSKQSQSASAAASFSSASVPVLVLPKAEIKPLPSAPVASASMSNWVINAETEDESKALNDDQEYDDLVEADNAARETILAAARERMAKYFPNGVLPDPKDLTAPVLENVIANWVKTARDLPVAPGRMDPLDGLLDSITAMTMAGELSSVFNVPVNVYAFMDNLTVSGIADVLVRLVQGSLAATRASVADTPVAMGQEHGAAGTAGAGGVAAPLRPVAHILGLGTAVPTTGGPQTLITRRMGQLMGLSQEDQRKFERIGENSGVKWRHMVFKDLESCFFGRRGKNNDASIEERNNVYQIEAPKLAHKAALAAIKDWGGDKSEITHVVAVTCTGVTVPGLHDRLLQSLGLEPDTEGVSVMYSGCFGCLSGFKTAKAFAAQNPKHRVLLVCCELCSLHNQMTERADNLVAAALFADGAGAVIIGKEPREGERAWFEMHGSSAVTIPGTLDMMKWDLSNTGMQVVLSPAIPKEISAHVGQFARKILHEAGDPDMTGCLWAVHPGGPAIVKATENACGITQQHDIDTHEVLARNGNMSSATLIFVFKRMRDRLYKAKVQSDVKVKTAGALAGRWVPSLAFGPGLKVEGALLRTCF